MAYIRYSILVFFTDDDIEALLANNLSDDNDDDDDDDDVIDLEADPDDVLGGCRKGRCEYCIRKWGLKGA